MSRPVEFHLEAAREAHAARLWYMDRSREVADRFMDALDRATLSIAQNPERGAPGPRGTRRFRLQRYPYLLVYRLRGELVQIVAVAHVRRRPGYRRRR
jgi:plasmid stabilization system protein ParE